jgi:ubiquitin carboxyl-terminal hydrolase 4/11
MHRPLNNKSGYGNRKKMKQGQIHGKRANKRRDKHARALHSQQQLPPPQPARAYEEIEDSQEENGAATAAGDGPLIRLGEVLVVDWYEEAWRRLFGGSREDGQEGMRTYG